jgi:uncharacterized DUF497 family protein
MPYFEFLWTDKTVEHIAEHDISTEDFEEIIRHPVSRSRSRSSGLPAAFGYTSDGRYVIAIYELLDETTIIPVTAFEVDEPAS